MSPERVEHGETRYAAVKALGAAIRGAKLPCRALSDSVAVRIDTRTAFQPGALVYCGEKLARGSLGARDPADRSIIHHARTQSDALLTRIVSDGEVRLDPPGLTLEVSALFEAEERERLPIAAG